MSDALTADQRAFAGEIADDLASNGIPDVDSAVVLDALASTGLMLVRPPEGEAPASDAFIETLRPYPG